MTNPRRPRFAYVLSDGGWADTQAGSRADPLARRARRPDDPPLDRDRAADRRVRPHHVITDPAQALDHIAADTVAALRARTALTATHLDLST